LLFVKASLFFRSLDQQLPHFICADDACASPSGIRAAMPVQLTSSEQVLIDTIVRSGKGTAMDAMKNVNKTRENKGIDTVTKSSVYRFANGSTHARGKVEARGRKKVLKKGDVTKLDGARKRLLKAADSEHQVTYEDIQDEAGLTDHCSNRVVQDALREIGVRFRAPRTKVCLTTDDAKTRLQVAKHWVKRPASFWSTSVHAYVDNKAFPLPLSPAQKAKLRKTKVTGHLRKSSEGVVRGCTKPRLNHSFLGIPAVTISAALAEDKIIMWHVVGKTWNGAAAAHMYSGPLKKALKKKWGEKRRYTIVEDGDRKGNQSGLGVAAKEAAKIRAMTLPPRTPAWMPLDYAIWNAIDKKMDAGAPDWKETKDEYLKRLEMCARSLPRAFVRKVIGRMKANIQGVIDARGFHSKND
jgi:hypothetical protein